ncbi:MAG: hypothetical protein JWP31_657 [Aeromicrobium sp.]|nr:hypothetical protein [Aeromicrobium sp.]
MTASVIVVGGGLAGWRAVAQLRHLGFEGTVTLLGEEPHTPYDRPALSKQVLAGERHPDDLTFATDEEIERLGVDVRTQARVTSVRPGAVTLDGGEVLEADAIVVATGVRARVPEGVTIGGRVHVLRGKDDSNGLRTALAGASSILVLGGGFIGAEVAVTARKAGLTATLVEARESLLAGALPAEVGAVVAGWHAEHGVEVLTGRAVTSISQDEAGVAVVLDDGSELEADLAVIGFGTHLDAEPLLGLPMAEGGGVECDASGRVVGLDGVYAAGDVAAWFDPVVGRPVRREHWSTAADQGSLVAHAIVGAEPPPHLAKTLPYFWSDQYEHKVQVLGWPTVADRGDWLDDGQGEQAVYGFHRGDDLVGVVTLGSPRLLVRYRKLLMAAQVTPG